MTSAFGVRGSIRFMLNISLEVALGDAAPSSCHCLVGVSILPTYLYIVDSRSDPRRMKGRENFGLESVQDLEWPDEPRCAAHRTIEFADTINKCGASRRYLCSKRLTYLYQHGLHSRSKCSAPR